MKTSYSYIFGAFSGILSLFKVFHKVWGFDIIVLFCLSKFYFSMGQNGCRHGTCSWATNGFELFHVFFSLWYGPFKGVGSGIQLHISHWGQIFDKRLKPLKHETLDTHPHNGVTFYESSSHKPLVLGNDGTNLWSWEMMES